MLRRTLFVQSFGLFNIHASFGPFVLAGIDARPDGRVSIRRDDVDIELIEHSAVSATQAAVDRLRLDDRGRPSHFVGSSITNSYRADVTADFVPLVESFFTSDSVVIIGFCLGAGIGRIQALPARVRRRTILVSGQGYSTCGDVTRESLGILDVIPRARIIDRLVAAATDRDDGIEYGHGPRHDIGANVVRLSL